MENIIVKKHSDYKLKSIPPFEQVMHVAKQQPLLQSAKHTLSRGQYMVLLCTLMLMGGAGYLVYQLQPQFEQLYFERINTTWGVGIIVLSVSLLVVKLCFLCYILSLYMRYKPVKPVPCSMLPACTVIVPAYNEGKLVWHTIMSLAASNYPEDKLELIAIDDGSMDDTWEWMIKAKEALGDRLSIYQQPVNKGKRQALNRGFKLGSGEIFVTVDSDSVVEQETLRIMVSPFVVNKKCGAVAGNVAVLNKKAIIPRMLNVSFAFSFEFVRSAQSVLGSVLCTPGALAAYRRDAVLACLPEWVNQTFLGQPSDIGEDRAMTNMILKQGYHVLFQRDAYVHTNTPEKYKNLYKMFIRWERSNVRENIMMGKYAFGDFREGPKNSTRILLLDQWLKILLSYPTILLMFVFIVMHPVLFFSSAIFSISIFSSIQAIFYAARRNVKEAIWAYTYSIFYLFGLFWITPYAIATTGKRGWLTRDLNTGKEHLPSSIMLAK